MVLAHCLLFVVVLVAFVFPILAGLLFGVTVDGARVIEQSRAMQTVGFMGLTIWPCIFLAGNARTAKNNATVVLQHEQIHLEQQKECLVLPFYLLYGVELLLRQVYLKQKSPYRSLSFEREAYDNERRSTYLAKRKPFAWRAYAW
jgi:hypothetical protein